MKIKELRALAESCQPNWWQNEADPREVYAGESDGPVADFAIDAEAKLAVTLRNLAPLWIAHLEAAMDLGKKFNATQATYTDDGEETPETRDAAEQLHAAFILMAERQNALGNAIKAIA